MFKNQKNIFLFLLILFYLEPSFAQSFGDLPKIDAMFANFHSSAISLINLIKYLSATVGVYLCVSSIFGFIKVANGREEIKKPIATFIAGVFMFSLIPSLMVIENTMALPASPGDILIPGPSNSSDAFTAARDGVLAFIQMIGYIAFFRGILLLNQAGMGKNDVMGKGLTHLFGGAAAINIKIFAQVLGNTFAPGIAIPLG